MYWNTVSTVELRAFCVFNIAASKAGGGQL